MICDFVDIFLERVDGIAAIVTMYSLTSLNPVRSPQVLADFFGVSVAATVCTPFSPLPRAFGAFPATIGQLHVRTEGQIYRLALSNWIRAVAG